MTVALPIPGSPDAIATFDGLVSAVQDTLKDTTLESLAPRFIYLAECEFNRVLNNLEDEYTVLTDFADERITLPNDFKALRSLYIDADPRAVLRYMAPADLRTVYASVQTGQPEAYSIIANEIVFGPAPDTTYTVSLTYDRMLTNLSAENQSNWLVEKHADLYLYTALVHAEFFGWNDERIPMLRQFVDGVIAQINGVGINRRRADDIATIPADYF